MRLYKFPGAEAAPSKKPAAVCDLYEFAEHILETLGSR